MLGVWALCVPLGQSVGLGILALAWVISAFMVSNAPLAELTNKPSTNAACVAITPTPNLTTSRESALT